jgi:hypothetical protein
MKTLDIEKTSKKTNQTLKDETRKQQFYSDIKK